MAVSGSAGAAVSAAPVGPNSTADSNEHVRFGLTFCSPHRLTPAQGNESHEIFAKISHGQQKFEVIQWPSPALPFNLTLGSSLFVQVFSAKDALAFQRGNADPLAVCHVPISRVADLVRTSHTRTLNLALDSPDNKSDEAACGDSQLLVERFERSVQSASKYPMQPKICIVVEPFKGDAVGGPAGPAGPPAVRTESGRFATPPSIEVVTTRGRIGQLMAGPPPRQVPSEAEILLRSVSAPTAKDLSNGIRPFRLSTDTVAAPTPTPAATDLANRLSTNTMQDLSNTMQDLSNRLSTNGVAAPTPATVSGQNGSPTLPIPKVSGQKGSTTLPTTLTVFDPNEEPKRSLSGTARAVMETSAKKQSQSPPRVFEKASPLGSRKSSSAKSPGKSPGKSPSPVKAQTQVLTPFSQTREFGSPRSRSQTSNNSEVPNWTVTWQTRWAEEHARIQRLAADFERAFRQQQKSEDRKIRSLEQSVSLYSERREAWQLKRQMAAWRQWMASEKASRSFAQLTGEHDELKTQHEQEKLEVTEKLESGTQDLKLKAEQSRLLSNREMASSAHMHRFWVEHMAEFRAGLVMAAWRRYSSRLNRLDRLGSSLTEDEVFYLMHRAFHMWLVDMSSAKREALRIEASSMQAEYPKRYRKSTASRVYEVLRWSLSARDARAEALSVGAVFGAWVRIAGRLKRYRDCGVLVLGLTSGGLHEQVLIRRCMAAWCNEVDTIRTGRSLAEERMRWLEVLSGLQARTFRLVGVIQSSGEVAVALSAMLSWRFFVADQRMSCALEQMRVEQQATKGVAGSMGTSLEGAKHEVRRERAAWEEERAELHYKLELVQAKLAESRAKTARVMKEKNEVEALCAFACEEELQTKGELVGSRSDRVHALEMLETKRGIVGKAESECRGRADACEARAKGAFAEIKELEAEAVKHREGRMTDLKETKALAKDAVSKHDATARDLMESRSSDQNMWLIKIRQAEQRRNKLEQDLLQANRAVTRQSPRQASFEVERQALQRRLEGAEGRLAQTEVNSCEEDMKLLRGEHELAKRRRDELESQVRKLEEQRAAQGPLLDQQRMPGARLAPLLDQQPMPGSRVDEQRVPIARLEEQRVPNSRLAEQGVPSSRLEEQRVPSSRLEEQRAPSLQTEEQKALNSRLEEQRAAAASAASAAASTAVGARPWNAERVGASPMSPRGRGSAGTDEQRNQDLRAVLEDVQRTVRAPRSPLGNSPSPMGSNMSEVGSPGLSPVRPPLPEGSPPRAVTGSPPPGMMGSPQSSHRSLPASPRGSLQGRSAPAPAGAPGPQAMNSPRGSPVSPRSQRMAAQRAFNGMPMSNPPFSARERSASNESLPSDSIIQGAPWSGRAQQPSDRPMQLKELLGGQNRESGASASAPASAPSGSGGSPAGGSASTTAATDPGPGKATHAASEDAVATSQEPTGSSSDVPAGSSTEPDAPHAWASRSRDAVAQRQEQQGPLQWLKTPPRSAPLEQPSQAVPGGEGPARAGEYPRNTALSDFASQPMPQQSAPAATPVSGPTPRGGAAAETPPFPREQGYPSYAEASHLSPRGSAYAEAAPSGHQSPRGSASAEAAPTGQLSPRGFAYAEAVPAGPLSPRGSASTEAVPTGQLSPRAFAYAEAGHLSPRGSAYAEAGQQSPRPSPYAEAGHQSPRATQYAEVGQLSPRGSPRGSPGPIQSPRVSPRGNGYAEPGPIQSPRSPRSNSISMTLGEPPPYIDSARGSQGGGSQGGGSQGGELRGDLPDRKNSDSRGSTSKPQSPRTMPRTPPRSPRARRPTPPPPSQAASSSAEADSDEVGRARNRPGASLPLARGMWRQQTLTEHDTERKTLQERVEQMRRQIDAERAAAPRRQYAGLP